MGYKTFCYICPSALTPSEELYEGIRPMAEQTLEQIMKRIHSVGSRELMAGNKMVNIRRPRSKVNRLLRATLGLACSLAYQHAVPHLNIVLTSTGFGVVNNENTAPASSERVNRLMSELDRQAGRYYDMLIEELCGTEGWGDSPQGRSCIRGLIYLTEHLKEMYQEPKLSLLVRVQMTGAERENQLIRLMGREQYDLLLESIRGTREPEEAERELIHRCRVYISGAFHEDGGGRTLRPVMEWLEEHPEAFAAYLESSAYKANHFTKYENEEESPCYFW